MIQGREMLLYLLCLDAACLFSLPQTVNIKEDMEGRVLRTAEKEKGTPVLCLRGVTGLWLCGEGGEGWLQSFWIS